MNFLASKLKKYYKTKGNKRIFLSGLSLNQLSLKIWEKLNYHNMDSSLLSRVINGKRLFTNEQLHAFCDVLQIPLSETEDLIFALQQDQYQRYGFDTYYRYNTSDIIDLLTLNIKSVDITREHGLLYQVIDTTEDLINKLNNYLGRESNSIYKRKLMSLLGELLYQQTYSYCCILPPDNAINVIRPKIRHQLYISKQIKSQELQSKGYIPLAFTYYALGKYKHNKEFRHYYLNSLSLMKNGINLHVKSDYLNLIFWRTIALNSIYLNDISLFKHARDHIQKIITENSTNYKLTYIVWALNTIARGQSYFGDSKALDTLHKSEEFNMNINWHDSLREISTIRNQLEVFVNLKTHNNSDVRNIAYKGLDKAKKYKVIKYIIFFEKYLNNC